MKVSCSLQSVYFHSTISHLLNVTLFQSYSTKSKMELFSALILMMVASSHAKSGDATYYNLGLTACGKTFTDNDLVAATPFSYWTNPNSNRDVMCRKKAIVTDPSTGKSVIVMIKDICTDCSRNDIDLSPAAFRKLHKLSVGRFRVKWDFI